MNKKNSKRYITNLLLSALLFLITGCEDIIEFKGSENERRLVVNHIINASESIHELYLSVSSPIYRSEDDWEYDWTSYFPEWASQWPPRPEDLPLEITVNDEKAELLAGSFGEIQYKTKNLTAGDILSLQVVPEILETVTAMERVPEPPVILSVDTSSFTDKNNWIDVFMRTQITLKDNPSERNYYRLLIKRKIVYNKGEQWEYEVVDDYYFIDQDIALNSLTDQGFEEDGNENRFRIFSDDLFQGDTYTINVYFPITFSRLSNKEEVTIDIELQALSESLFLYMRSVEQSGNRDIFSQPVGIYSNIKGGYGILGIYNPSHYIFKVSPEDYFFY